MNDNQKFCFTTHDTSYDYALQNGKFTENKEMENGYFVVHCSSHLWLLMK